MSPLNCHLVRTSALYVSSCVLTRFTVLLVQYCYAPYLQDLLLRCLLRRAWTLKYYQGDGPSCAANTTFTAQTKIDIPQATALRGLVHKLAWLFSTTLSNCSNLLARPYFCLTQVLVLKTTLQRMHASSIKVIGHVYYLPKSDTRSRSKEGVLVENRPGT